MNCLTYLLTYVGPTDTGRSNAYFVASLNGGPPGGRVSFGVARALLPPVELLLPLFGQYTLSYHMFSVDRAKQKCVRSPVLTNVGVLPLPPIVYRRRGRMTEIRHFNFKVQLMK